MLVDTVLVFLFCATAKPLSIGLHRRCVSQHLRKRHAPGGQDQQKYTVGVTSSCGWNDVFLLPEMKLSAGVDLKKVFQLEPFTWTEKLWKDSAS